MGTDKRARQKANRQAKVQAEKVEATKEVRERSTKRVGLIAGVIAVIIGLIVVFGFLRGGDDGTTTVSLNNVDDDPAASVELLSAVPDDFEPFAGRTALAAVEPAARNGAYSAAPPMTIDPAKSYVAAIATSAGTFRFDLFPAEAPETVNNFVNLARDGYYDGTEFHRVLEGFMAQGGDPTGSGTGGPGYQFADEFDPGLRFDGPGVLAMANAGPATNGSQFFITFGPTPNLNDAHTIFGQLIGEPDGLADIVRVDPTNPADADVVRTVINSIRIAEG